MTKICTASRADEVLWTREVIKTAGESNFSQSSILGRRYRDDEICGISGRDDGDVVRSAISLPRPKSDDIEVGRE